MQTELPLLLIGPFVVVVGSLLGVVLGFVLADRQRRKEEERRAVAIRRMLQTEIDHNIGELKQWVQDDDPSLDNFPGQSSQIWETQLPVIPTVLVELEKITKVHDFYFRRRSLSEYAAEQRNLVSALLQSRMANPTQFSGHAYKRIAPSAVEELKQRSTLFIEAYKDLRVIENDAQK